MKKFLLILSLVVLSILNGTACVAGTWTWNWYTSNDDLYLRSSFDGVPRYDYRLGAGGAVIEMVDCLTGNNLIAPSHIGNSTDRVIQWTFWSSPIKVPEPECGHPDDRFNMNQAGNRDDIAAETMSVESHGNFVDIWCKQRDQWQPCYDDNLDGTITYLIRYEMAAGGVLKIRKVARLGSLWKQYTGIYTYYHTHFEAWIPMSFSPATFDAMAMRVDANGNPLWFYNHGNLPTHPKWPAETGTFGYSIVYRLGAHATNHSVAFIFGKKDLELFSLEDPPAPGLAPPAGFHKFNCMPFDVGMALIPYIDLNNTPTGTVLDIETWILPRPHLTSNTSTWLDILVPQIPSPKAYGPGHVLTGELKDIRDDLTALTGQTGTKTHQLAPLIQ